MDVSLPAVDVEGGKVLLEVDKDASRPFVVRAAGSEVTATGTAFVVRYMPAILGNQDSLDITWVPRLQLDRPRMDQVQVGRPMLSRVLTKGD